MPLHDEDASFNASYAYVGDDDSQYFRLVHGRRLNVLNTGYLLPVDDDEVKRSELHHRMLQFVFSGRIYLGPVKEALQFGQQRRILDLGTGGGFWAIAMADEFPRAEVIGIDLAPIQPRMVPSNCTFELCDLDQLPIPYPDNHFDFIHARYMHTGIRDYPRFLKEIARLLRPGGLVLIIEPNLHPTFMPTATSVVPPAVPHGGGLPCAHPLLLSISSPNLAAGSSAFVEDASSSYSLTTPSSVSTPTSRRPSPHSYPTPSASMRDARVDLPESTFLALRTGTGTTVSAPAVSPIPQSSSIPSSSITWAPASAPTFSGIPPTLASLMNPVPSPLTVTLPPPAPPSLSSSAPSPIPTPISASTTSTSAPTPSPTPSTRTASLPSNPLRSTTPSNPRESPAPIHPRTSQTPSHLDLPQPGWTSLWETYRACLRQQGVDPTIPERLPALLSATGQFETIVDHEGNIPVGFWPKDDLPLTVGQLQWMDYELFIPALRPLFLSLSLPPSQVDRLIKNAQHDLYYPSTCQSTRLHIVYASKHMS